MDKPEGITSHDVVQRVRRALRVRSAGHTGTLDPFAHGLLLMLAFAQFHDGTTWLILAGLALAGGLAQLTLTQSLRLAPVALVMPMDYTSLLWATLLGAWLFAELPTHWTWVGAPVIVASGLVIVWREHRAHRKAIAEVAEPGAV